MARTETSRTRSRGRGTKAPLPVIDRLALVREMIVACAEGIKENGSFKKTGVGEIIRLLSLEKELAGEDSMQEIKVTWLEPQRTAPVF
jgi:hypothetical protein